MTTRSTLLLALGLSAGLHVALLAIPGQNVQAIREVTVDVEVLRVPPPLPPAPPSPGGLATARPPAGMGPPRVGGPRRHHDPLSAAGADPLPAPSLPPLPGPGEPAPAPASSGTAGASDPGGAGGSGAAAPSGDGRGAGTAPDLLADYKRRLNDAVHRRFEYPRRAQRQRLQGRVIVRVVIDDAGIQRGVHVAASSGHDVLDEAALAMVGRVQFPAPPPELHWGTREVVFPVDYTLR